MKKENSTLVLRKGNIVSFKNLKKRLEKFNKSLTNQFHPLLTTLHMKGPWHVWKYKIDYHRKFYKISMKKLKMRDQENKWIKKGNPWRRRINGNLFLFLKSKRLWAWRKYAIQGKKLKGMGKTRQKRLK